VNTLATLCAARDLFTTPVAWNKRGNYAADATGKQVGVDSKRAVCWCVLGAVAKVADSEVSRIHASQALYRACPDRSLTNWNDRPATSFADLKKLFDTAIEAESRAGVA
jgi:hypothetical protein